MSKPFRFAAQISSAPEMTAASWAAQARKVEDLGYSALMMPDHFGTQFSPTPALAAVAAATTDLKIGSLLYDNDYRHPLMLAKDFATLDVLSDGRLEMSLGAGWMLTDYEEAGLVYDSPKIRVDRFEEGVQVIKGLMAAEGPYSFTGTYYTVTEHTPFPRPLQRPRPPLIIGAGGRRMLSIAAREADIVSINVNLRGGKADEAAAKNASPAATSEKIAWVKEAAGARFDEIELNTLIGFANFTDDRRSFVEPFAPVFGCSVDEALHVPLALIGTVEEMIEELEWRRAEWGLSYFAIEGAWELLGPVVQALTGK